MFRHAFILAALLLFAPAFAPLAQQAPPPPPSDVATFAAGCFWCVEEAFDKLPGVISTTSGYMGGDKPNPSYEEVSAGATGHTEVVQVRFDPSQLGYERLLEQFWLNHDPTVTNRQFCDIGSQYRPSIFHHDEEQKRLAEASKARLQASKPFEQPILTPIVPAGEFWPAEARHQDYYQKNPIRYRLYTAGCGRYSRLDELWGDLRQ